MTTRSPPPEPIPEPDCVVCGKTAGFHTADGEDLCHTHWSLRQHTKRLQKTMSKDTYRQADLFGSHR